jgi:uncharacterized protein (TIGR03435 family)
MGTRSNKAMFGRRMGASVMAAIGLIATAFHARAQSRGSASESQLPSYEVVSVKPYKPLIQGLNAVHVEEAPDEFSAEGITVRALIQRAYSVDDYQILGAPDWISSDKYSIEAKMDQTQVDNLSKLKASDRAIVRRRMLQAMLEDRFKLRLHRETRELPIYSLVVAKGGAKLRESVSKESLGGTLGWTSGSEGMPVMVGQNIGIAILANTLSATLRRPVMDSTGLKSRYNIRLEFAPDRGAKEITGDSSDESTRSSGRSIFEALQEQLGLKLESGKGPVEAIVIDHVERPSGN